MKSIREIADERGYDVVETTSSMTGYPEHIKDAVVGFNSEDEAREFAMENDLDLIWIDQRDGWQMWHRGNPFSHSVALDPEDIGAITFARTEDDVYGWLRDELEFYRDEIDGNGEIDLGELKTKIDNCKEAIEAISTKEDCEAVPFFEGCGFDDVVKVDGVMGWYYDTKHYCVAAVRY